MAKTYIDLSGRKGLAKKFAGDLMQSSGSPELRYLANDGEMVQGIFNPMRKYGFLAPVPGAFTSVTENDGTSNFTNRIRAVVYDSEYDVAFMAEDGDLAWRTPSGSLTTWGALNAGGSDITGSTLHYTDIEIYQVNGTKKAFFSYQKSTGGDILLFGYNSNFSSTTTNATWLSGTVSGAFNTGATSDVFMRTADNGLMYIYDTNFVHRFDGTSNGGTNGTVSPNAVTFPSGFFLVDAVDHRGYQWMAVQSTPLTGIGSYIQTSGTSRIAGVYVWDRKSSVVGSVDFIPMSGVREIRKLYITPEGELRAIVIASNRLTQIRRYNGNTFEVMRELGLNSFPTFRDSFGFMGNLATWLGYDGYMYAHGRIAEGEDEGLYIIGDTTGTVGASPSNGAILVLDNNGSSTSQRDGILWSAKSNAGTVYNRYLYPNSTGSAPLAGNPYSPVKYLSKLSTVNYINVFCAPTAAIGSTTIATVSIYFNQSATAFKTFTVTKSEANKGYISIPIRKPYVNSVQIKVAWDTGNTIGDNDFLPSFAEIDYSPTTTAK